MAVAESRNMLLQAVAELIASPRAKKRELKTACLLCNLSVELPCTTACAYSPSLQVQQRTAASSTISDRSTRKGTSRNCSINNN